MLQRQQRRPHRHASREILGAVDGVDDPTPLGFASRATLLTENGVRGARRGEAAANHLFDGTVGVGDRGVVGFGVDAQIGGAETRDGDLVCQLGELQGQGEIVVAVTHGRGSPRR